MLKSQTEQKNAAPCLFLGFQTAALYWRAVKRGTLPYPQPLDLQELPDTCVHGLRDALDVDLSPLGLRLHDDGLASTLHLQREQLPADGHSMTIVRLAPDGIAAPVGEAAPLHLLVPRSSQRARQHGLVTHVVSGTLPPSSLYRVSDSIAVSSPELTCLHLMRGARALPLIELLCEWCGLYALGPYGGNCAYKRPPVTDLSLLHEFVSQARAIRGHSSLEQVLSHVGERLASPRETEFFLMLTLPPNLGGFGLPIPAVNQQIPLKATSFAHLSAHDYFEADLIWPEAWLVVEYDGFDDHERTAAQIAADKERRSVLAAMGYTVVVVTKRDIVRMQALERKAGQIATALRTQLPVFGPDELEAHERLFGWLFDATHDHMPFGSGYC